MKRTQEIVEKMKQRGFLTTEEIVRRTGYNRATLHKYILGGEVTAQKISACWYIEEKSMRKKLGAAAFLMDEPEKKTASKG